MLFETACQHGGLTESAAQMADSRDKQRLLSKEFFKKINKKIIAMYGD